MKSTSCAAFILFAIIATCGSQCLAEEYEITEVQPLTVEEENSRFKQLTHESLPDGFEPSGCLPESTHIEVYVEFGSKSPLSRFSSLLKLRTDVRDLFDPRMLELIFVKKNDCDVVNADVRVEIVTPFWMKVHTSIPLNDMEEMLSLQNLAAFVVLGQGKRIKKMHEVIELR